MLQLRESKGCWWARLVVQVGRSVEGSCWRKVGMVGIWESIRMEVSRVLCCCMWGRTMLQ